LLPSTIDQLAIVPVANMIASNGRETRRDVRDRLAAALIFRSSMLLVFAFTTTSTERGLFLIVERMGCADFTKNEVVEAITLQCSEYDWLADVVLCRRAVSASH